MTNSSYTDYVGSLFFKGVRVANAIFTPKVVDVESTKVVLCHIEGVEPATGRLINFDMWPRNEATAEDIKSLPKEWEDIIFRVGYYSQLEQETGEITTLQGAPKWIAAKSHGRDFEALHGKRREFK